MENRSFQSGAAAAAPTPPATPSTGYPQNGDPTVPTPATVPGAYWFHQIGEELRAIIVAGGGTPSNTTLNQVLTALQAGFGLGMSIGASGYITLPGGVIVQWGLSVVIGSGVNRAITFPIAFPTACYAVIPAYVNTSGDSAVGTVVTSQVRAYSKTGTTIRNLAATSLQFFWVALGN